MFGKILFVVVTTISAIAYCLAKTPSTNTTTSESTVCVLQPKDSTYVAKVGTRFEYTAESTAQSAETSTLNMKKGLSNTIIRLNMTIPKL